MINAKEKRAVLLEEIMKSSSWHERSELVTPGAICLRYWFLKARKDQLSKRQGMIKRKSIVTLPYGYSL